jgi:hypothetical protein
VQIRGGQPSTSSVEEAHIVHPVLTELAVGCRMLQIEIDAIEFPMPELQEQMKTMSHLNILVSWIPIHILQILKIGIFHEIRLCADEANQEMTKVMDERAQLQQQYETVRSNKRVKLKEEWKEQ